MMPILYPPSKTGVAMATYIQSIVNDSSLGLGFLTDCISAVVTRERNGAFELEIQYPITGALYGDIQTSSWIKAKAAVGGNAQLFRVYKISKPLDGIVTINAEHISYMLNYAMCKPFSVTGKCSAVMEEIQDNIENGSAYPFTLSVGADKIDTATVDYTLSEPENVRALLGGREGSMLDVFGGEYEFDNLDVKLWNSLGQDNGVQIRYGKNLTDLKQDISDESMLTGVLPFWRRESEDEDGETVSEYSDRSTMSSGSASATIYNQEAAENFPYYPRIVPLDLSDEEKYQNRPPIYDATDPSPWTPLALYALDARVTRVISSETHRYICISQIFEDAEDGTSHGKGVAPETEDGKAYWEEYFSSDEYSDEAQKYFNSHNMSEPTVSLDVSFVDLSSTDEYKDVLPLESVDLCDTVHVEYGELGVTATLKVISTQFNVLEDRYDQISLGNAKSNFTNTIQEVTDFTEEQARVTPKRYNVSDGINHLMELISTSYGGYKINGADWGFSGETIFADSKTKSQATNVVRINQNGIFFSRKGANGPYESGFGIDGQLVANMLTAWRINAERITTGFISADGTKNGNYWDLDNGDFALGVSALVEIEDYTGSITYKPGDIIERNGVQYKCIKECTNIAPPNATYWQVYTGGQTLYDLLMHSNESAATADGKAVVADGKAVTADGKAVAAQASANNAQSTANTANSTANSALSAANSANNTLSVLNTFEGVFNKLTKNGTEECIKKDTDDHLYINASWIKTGVLQAALVDTANLKVNSIFLSGKDITSDCDWGTVLPVTFDYKWIMEYPYTVKVYIYMTATANYTVSDAEIVVKGLPKIKYNKMIAMWYRFPSEYNFRPGMIQNLSGNYGACITRGNNLVNGERYVLYFEYPKL